MQKIELIGNIGADANTERYAAKGYVRFRLGCTTMRRDEKGNPVKDATWYTVSAFVSSGLVPFLKKGTKLYVRGDLTTNVYTDKTGTPLVGLDVYSHEVELC